MEHVSCANCCDAMRACMSMCMRACMVTLACVRYTGLGTLIAVSFFQYFAGVGQEEQETFFANATRSSGGGVGGDGERGNSGGGAQAGGHAYSYYAPAPAPFPADGVVSAEDSLWNLVAVLKSLQALFGVSLYSFMSHHAVPSIVTPVLDPKHRMSSTYALGTYCVNGSAGITASRDKLHAHQLLARHKIGMPRTAFAASPKDTDNLVGLVGTAPLIVKLLESTQGKGVVLAETKKAAQSVIDAFRGLRANFLVQDFVKEAAGEDVRCLVIGGKVVAAMKRTAAGDDFRSNLHRGGSAVTVRITKEEREAALRSAKVFGLGIAGVDLLRGSEGPKVLEVNSSPGFQGIEEATGKNIAGHLYDAIEKKVRPTPARKRKG